MFELNRIFTSVKKRNNIVIAFFGLLLCIGIFTFLDYGVSADEATQRAIGETSLDYVNRVIPLPFLDRPIAMDGPPEKIFETQRDRAYGVAFELPAEYLIQALGIKDAQAFDFRHLLNFLIFYIAVWSFYKTLSQRYENKLIALLGASILVLSPRIYGDAFFNNKDLVFLSLYTIACYTLIRWIHYPSIKSALYHALACALAIDVRLMAILLPLITIPCIVITHFYQSLAKHKTLAQLTIYLLSFSLFVILIWPWLWHDPIDHLREAFLRMAHFDNTAVMRFAGKVINGGNLPWYYIPVWIGITTPIFYSVLFMVGVAVIAWQTIRGGWSVLRQSGPFQDLLFVGLFFAPLLAVIVLHSVLYNGWRQMYFIYPAFVVVAVRGLVAIWDGSTQPAANKLLKPLVIVITALCLSYTTYWMIRWHPYQYLYFNVLAGQSSKRFDVDYWGVAYREPILSILNQDRSKKYAIYDAYSDGPIFDYPKNIEWGIWQLPHGINILNLPANDRARIIGDRTEACSDYVFTTVMGNRQQYLVNKPEFSLFHELKVDGQIIYSTFKRNVVLYDYYQPSLNKVIEFNNRNTQCFLRKGWGQNENWGVWSLGQHANLALFMPSGQPKTVTLDMRAFINPKHPSQTAYISINGVYQKTVVLTKQESNLIELTIPPSSYGKEWLQIEFAMPQAISPEELGIGNDSRKLGIGLVSAVFR